MKINLTKLVRLGHEMGYQLRGGVDYAIPFRTQYSLIYILHTYNTQPRTRHSCRKLPASVIVWVLIRIFEISNNEDVLLICILA